MSTDGPGSSDASPAASDDLLVFESARTAWATAEFVREPPAIAARAYIYALSAILMLGLGYSAFSRVAVSVQARGSLTMERAVFPVRAQAEFRVGKLLVSNNQAVKAGDVLLVSQSQLSDADYAAVREQTEQLKRKLARDAAEPDCVPCVAELGSLAESAYRLDPRTELAEPLSQLREALRELVNVRRQNQNLGKVTQGLVRQIRLAEDKLREIRKRSAETILAMQVEQLRNDIVAGRAQLAERRQAADGQAQSARNRVQTRLEELSAGLERHRVRHTVVAPANGIVADLRVSGAGQFVTSGQDLMQIIPADSAFMAELGVANKDVSKIRAGMPVRIALDAMPEREFGVLTGKVLRVPPSASKTDGPSPTYLVQIQLDRQTVRKDGTDHPFRLGMTLTGYVVTRHESLLVLGLKRLFNLRDELFGSS
jgi:multidrug resistance efflux pump